MVEKNRGYTDQIETSQRDDHMDCDSDRDRDGVSYKESDSD